MVLSVRFVRKGGDARARTFRYRLPRSWVTTSTGPMHPLSHLRRLGSKQAYLTPGSPSGVNTTLVLTPPAGVFNRPGTTYSTRPCWSSAITTRFRLHPAGELQPCNRTDEEAIKRFAWPQRSLATRWGEAAIVSKRVVAQVIRGMPWFWRSVLHLPVAVWSPAVCARFVTTLNRSTTIRRLRSFGG